MSTILGLVLVLMFLVAFVASEDVFACETTNPGNLRTEATSLKYIGFADFGQLKIACDVEKYLDLSTVAKKPITIAFFFTSALVWTKTLDLGPLRNYASALNVEFVGAAGFSLDLSEPFVLIDQAAPWLKASAFLFMTTTFDFYLHGALVDVELCDAGVFDKEDVRLFSGLANSKLALTQNQNFKHPICPYAFKNARLDYLIVVGMENDRLVRNVVSFLDVRNRQNRSLDLNASISYVNMQELYRVDIDERLLSPLVFSSTAFFSLEGKIDRIEQNLFKQLIRARSLSLKLHSVRDFVHSSDNRWLASLFYVGTSFESKEEMDRALKANSNNRVFIFSLIDSLGEYSYQDEDFCLFKYFPASKAIAVRLQHGDYLKTWVNNSCTVKFLAQNNLIVEQDAYGSEDASFLNFFPAELVDCGLDERLAICANFSFRNVLSQGKIYADYADLLYLLKWAQFVGPIVSFSLFSFLGFALNLLVILVISSKSNKREKLFDSKMFEYIRLNSAFVCAECFVNQFRLMSICMGFNSIYCSSILASSFTRYFTIIVTGYLGEIFKTGSIITGLMFSLQRLLETSEADLKRQTWLTSIRTTRVAVVIFSFSCVISISKIFEYSTTMTVFDSVNPFKLRQISFPLFKFESVFYIVHYVLNDFVILAVNLAVDVKLVFNIKRKLNAKITIKQAQCSLSNFSAAETKNLRNELQKKRSVEKKANALILSSVTVYFFCRLPELAGTFYFYFGANFRMGSACDLALVCYLAASIVEYLYMISYIFNIIFYYKFNGNFQKGFKNFFGLQKSANYDAKIISLTK